MKNRLINLYATLMIWSIVLAISLYIPSLYVDNYKNSIYSSKTLMTIIFLPELIATSFFVNAYFKTEKIHRKILMILWILMLFAIPLVIFSGCEFVGKGVAAFLISIFVPSLFILSGIYFAIFHRVWQGIFIGLLSFASIIQTLIFLQG